MRASGYPGVYDNQRPAASAQVPARNSGALFPDADCAEPAVKEARRSVSVPVHFAGPELGPERETAAAAEVAIPKKRAPSAEQAAVRLQASARGFLARRMVREVRAVEREAEVVAARLAAEAEALRGNTRARVGVGEELMRLLLRLDAVRGVREYRRRVTKRVLALQDAVDALEIKPAPAPAPVEMSEENGMATEAAEQGLRIESEEQGVRIEPENAVDSPVSETVAEMDMAIDGGIATSDERDLGEAELMMDGENAEDAQGENAEEAEGEWEMVAEEDAVPGENPAPKEQKQEPAAEEKEKNAEGGGAADGLDARKVMEMVAAMCERSAQQGAVIGALAERVDALERAVRRVEVAERRRRRNKKLKKDGKAARSCYSD